ncbi:MAG: recombinase family protein [Stellaceae bacterium]
MHGTGRASPDRLSALVRLFVRIEVFGAAYGADLVAAGPPHGGARYDLPIEINSAPGDVVITPAVDRFSRDTTDLLIIARDMQRAGADIRSLAEPFLDTHPTSPRSSSPSLAWRPSSNAAAFSNAPRAAGPTPRRKASNSAASRPSP